MTQLIKRLLEVKNLLIFAILYTLFVTIAFLITTSGLPKVDFDFPIDKVVHIIIYIFLSLVWILYFHTKNHNVLKIKTIVIVLIVLFFYGTVIEVLQERVTITRHADIFDVFANTIGSLLGLIVFFKVKNRIKT